MKENQSNKWDLDIDIEKVVKREKEEYNEVYKIVKEKERSILHTEMRMQKESIYDEKYQPDFVSEMNEEQLEQFSNILSQKLRQVKLAISKANLGQNRFMLADNEKKVKEKEREKEFRHTLPNITEPKKKPKSKLAKTFKSPYACVRNQILTTEGFFNKYKEDFDKGHDNLKKTFEIIMKKQEFITSKKYRKPNLRILDDDSHIFD